MGGDREAISTGNCSITIWHGSEVGISFIQEKQFTFWTQFPKFLFSGISNLILHKVCDVLHWVNFLATKTFSSIFCSTICWGRLSFISQLFSIFLFKFFIQVLFKLRVSSLLSLIDDASVDIVDVRVLFSFVLKLNSHHPFMFTPPLNNCCSVKSMLKLLAFKWLERVIAGSRMIRGRVNLVLCLN